MNEQQTENERLTAMIRELAPLYGTVRMSEKLGIGPVRIKRLMAAAGIPLRKRTNGTTKGPHVKHKVHALELKHGKSIKTIIEEAQAEGLNQKRLAERLGISPTHVRHLCRAYGLQPLGRGSGVYRHHGRAPSSAAGEAARLACQKIIRVGDVQMTLSAWAEKYNLTRSGMRHRLANWPDENIISGTPPQRR